VGHFFYSFLAGVILASEAMYLMGTATSQVLGKERAENSLSEAGRFGVHLRRSSE